MAKVLITGGAGFIGSHLTEELVNQGYQVLVYDSLRTGKLENLVEPYDFIRGDIRDYHLLAAAMQDCRYVFHLAALTNIVESMERIEECISINLHGTLNVLKAARENEVKKVIFASSAAVYGDSPELPKTEIMRPDPLSPYAITKADGEYYCRLYLDSFQLPTVCARFFNVFGERQDPNSAYASAIPIFIHHALQNLPLRIYGDGTQTRDFIYVRDIVKALIFLMEKGTGIYNVGYGKSIDINTLVAIILKHLNKTNLIQHWPDRPGEIKHSFAAVQKLTALGFRPDFSLQEGLKRTIEDFRAKNVGLVENIG